MAYNPAGMLKESFQCMDLHGEGIKVWLFQLCFMPGIYINDKYIEKLSGLGYSLKYLV